MKEKIKLKTKKIGIDSILLADELPQKNSSLIIARQIIKSGTSIGTIYRAACLAKSTADFINKMKIVEEETDETIYWLEILDECNLIKAEKMMKLKSELSEILAIIISAIKTLRSRK